MNNSACISEFEDATEALIEGQDVLLFSPQETVSRECYELAASMRKGLCLIIYQNVSILLQQIQRIQKNGWNVVYPGIHFDEEYFEKIIEEAKRGQIKFLLLSPEQLNLRILEKLQSIELSLFVLESAHCISAWGHDYRLEYVKFQNLKQKFPQVPILAISGLANYIVQKDIPKQLGINQTKCIQTSFDFSSIYLSVEKSFQPLKSIEKFLNLRPSKKGLIFCKSQLTAENICKELRDLGFSVKSYHSSYSLDINLEIETEFKQNQLQTVCLSETEKHMQIFSPVDWFIHLNMPLQIEQFYQDISSMGLSGLPSESKLILQSTDIQTQQSSVSQEFETEKRRSLAQLRLNRMITYSQSQVCRRRVLLAYFNQIMEKNCNHCDFCVQDRAEFDGTLIAQKALSAIYRTHQKLSLNSLINILRGTLNQEILENKFDQLPTFSVGKEVSYPEWETYFHQLHELGLVETSLTHGAFQLTSISRKVLNGESKVYLNQINFSENKLPNPPINELDLSSEINHFLYEELRQVRSNIAKELNIPSFFIFSNQTLEEIARHQPTTVDELINIKGVGEYKINVYGSEFLACINKYKQTQNP